MVRFKPLVLFALMIAWAPGPAGAALVNGALPENTFIEFGGANWAWAFPIDATRGTSTDADFDLSRQRRKGWRLPTPEEMQSAPSASDFIFDGANVPLRGVDPVSGARFETIDSNLTGDAACAAPYFTTNRSLARCDWGHSPGGDGSSFTLPWVDQPGFAGSLSEQLVIRNLPAPIAAPASLGMLVMALAALALLSRRRKPGLLSHVEQRFALMKQVKLLGRRA